MRQSHFSSNSKAMKKLICLIVLFSASHTLADIKVKVIDVHDGDTLTAINEKKQETYKIRLASVDTPETDFQNSSQGTISMKARSFLMSLIPADKIINLTNESQTDRHGRILGVLKVNDIEINKEIVRNGWGLPYDIDGTNHDKLLEYAEACLEAEENQRGMFAPENQSEFEEPYNFRMRVQKKLGRNIIGNILTQKLYTALEIKEVPVCLRIFFSNEILAQSKGYSF